MKILLIDDNKEVTDMYSFYLENHGFSCQCINDGKDGVDAVKKGDFDAAVLDLMMPKLSGYDILKTLKASDVLKTKNIFVATAQELSEEIFQELLNAGVKAVLQKPISLSELKNKLNEIK